MIKWAIMSKEQSGVSINHQVGVIVGTIDALKTSVDRLATQFDDHLKEHRATWLWIIPTLLSLATLIVVIVGLWID